mgnify:CR=1 FL=1
MERNFIIIVMKMVMTENSMIMMLLMMMMITVVNMMGMTMVSYEDESSIEGLTKLG